MKKYQIFTLLVIASVLVTRVLVTWQYPFADIFYVLFIPAAGLSFIINGGFLDTFESHLVLLAVNFLYLYLLYWIIKSLFERYKKRAK
jgi:prepilin signal peptidase PulO-like enzyme (type II secretory pathway)